MLKSQNKRKLEYNGTFKLSKAAYKLSKNDTGDEGDLYKSEKSSLDDTKLSQTDKNSSKLCPFRNDGKGKDLKLAMPPPCLFLSRQIE